MKDSTLPTLNDMEKDLKALLELIGGDGGSGGDGGGEGGGSGVMRVNAGINYDAEEDENNWVFDKTYEEIHEAVQAGQLVYVRSGSDRDYYFSAWYPEDEYFNHFYYVFRSLGDSFGYGYFTLKDDDTVTYDTFEATHDSIYLYFTYENGEWSCETPFSDLADSMYDILNGSTKLYGVISISFGDDGYFSGFGVTPWSTSYTDVKFNFQFMSEDGTTIYSGWCSLSEGDGDDDGVSGAISTISATPLT